MVQWVMIKDCREEDILAEDIVNKDGMVIARKYTMLNHYILSILRYFGIAKIRIFSERKDPCSEEHRSYLHIREDYKENIQQIKKILCNLVAGRNLEMERIHQMIKNFCSHIEESYTILKVLGEEKQYDEYTYTHSLNVAIYAMLIGKWMKLEQEDLEKVVIAGLLHDIGKIRVPYEVLNKRAKLSKEEFDIIKMHSAYGYEILKKQKEFPEDICRAVLLHHERLDKSGYPYGYGEEQICLFARIIAVADVYDAITTNRVYRNRMTPFEAFTILKTTEVKNLDPNIVNLFMTNISIHYVGMKVLLNTGEIGKIVYIPPQSISDPIVDINHDYIDFSKRRDKNIIEIV